MRQSLVLLMALVFCSCLAFEKKHQTLSFEAECQIPCFYGITPGEISYEQAVETVAASSILQSQNADVWYLNNDGSRIEVRLIQSSPISGHYLSRIELNNRDGNRIVSLGDLINAGYLPVQVFRGNVAGPNAVNLLLVFGKDRQIFAHVVAVDSVTATSLITYLVLVARQDREWVLEDIRSIQGFEHEISWLGYKSVEAYFH